MLTAHTSKAVLVVGSYGERRASLADMRRVWPDKTDEELLAAAEAIAAAGGILTVGPVRVGHLHDSCRVCGGDFAGGASIVDICVTCAEGERIALAASTDDGIDGHA